MDSALSAFPGLHVFGRGQHDIGYAPENGKKVWGRKYCMAWLFRRSGFNPDVRTPYHEGKIGHSNAKSHDSGFPKQSGDW
jgi:hypothetical protein